MPWVKNFTQLHLKISKFLGNPKSSLIASMLLVSYYFNLKSKENLRPWNLTLVDLCPFSSIYKIFIKFLILNLKFRSCTSCCPLWSRFFWRWDFDRWGKIDERIRHSWERHIKEKRRSRRRGHYCPHYYCRHSFGHVQENEDWLRWGFHVQRNLQVIFKFIFFNYIR